MAPAGYKQGEITPSQLTHKRHARPAPARTIPPHFNLLRTACAPTSTHRNVCMGLYLLKFKFPLR
jgi:hypothetical protein